MASYASPSPKKKTSEQEPHDTVKHALSSSEREAVTAGVMEQQLPRKCQYVRKKCKVLSDERIRLIGVNTKEHYPDDLWLVTAEAEVKGKMVAMTFITNNFEWAPYSVCELYRCCWDVEVFFKKIKQTLQLADSLGYNENAVWW